MFPIIIGAAVFILKLACLKKSSAINFDRHEIKSG